jgi:hypothetical protein
MGQKFSSTGQLQLDIDMAKPSNERVLDFSDFDNHVVQFCGAEEQENEEKDDKEKESEKYSDDYSELFLEDISVLVETIQPSYTLNQSS